MENYNPEKEEKVKKTLQTAKGMIVRVFGIIMILLLSFDSYYNIEEQEQAVLTTFGVATAVTEPGLHFKIPFIQKVQKVNTTIQGFALGYDQSDNESREEDSLMITSDYNFVNVDFLLNIR